MSSSMYTGMTSGTLKVKEQRDEIEAKKKKVSSNIRPAYDQLTADLDSELARMSDISTIVDGAYVTDDAIRFELAARKRYVDFIRSLKSKYERAVKDVKSWYRDTWRSPINR